MRLLRNFIICLFCCVYVMSAYSSYAIVFVHIGKELPNYLATAISQARLFNPQGDIYVVAEQRALEQGDLSSIDQQLRMIPCESLQLSPEHLLFNEKSSHDTRFRNGFWRYATERFFYLYDLMQHHGLQKVFHLESDNMLYVDLKTILPIFERYYPHIGATFDNDVRCIPGFIFINNASSLQSLVQFMAEWAHEGTNDMEMIARFRNIQGENWISHLPIIMPEYMNFHPLVALTKHEAKEPQLYWENLNRFNSLFDAAAMGQFVGGGDPRNGHFPPGFINESSVFQCSYLKFFWRYDEQKRRVPYVVCSALVNNICGVHIYPIQYRINNLHIHSKNLSEFRS